MTDITELAQRVKRIISDVKLKHGGNDTYAPIMKWDEFLALVEALEKAQQHENEWKSLCEAAAVDLDDWREIDDKSRDLLCKLADTVIAKAEQSAEWERKAISNFEDCAEMSSRLEELNHSDYWLSPPVIAGRINSERPRSASPSWSPAP